MTKSLTTFLRETAEVLSDLEVRYQEASFDEQVQLRDLLVQAMNNSDSSDRLTRLERQATFISTTIAIMNQSNNESNQTRFRSNYGF